VSAAHVHSLLHVNLNCRDIDAASAFYARLLGLELGMSTSGEPTSGASLGIDGLVTTLVRFQYDSRGPRAGAALELVEWRSPGPVGTPPQSGRHAGIAAVGYQVPSLDTVRRLLADPALAGPAALQHWPVRGIAGPLLRLRDPDGVVVEVAEEASLPGSRFSHLRLNVRDLAASVEWYSHLGLQARAATALDAQRTANVQSLSPGADPSMSFELTAWTQPRTHGRPIAPANHLGFYRVALGVDDVIAARDQLCRSWDGVPDPIWVELPGTRLGGVSVLFLRDPDGTIVELVQRPRSAMRGRPPG